MRSWPLLVLALPAAVAVWSGWVGIGELTGFGVIRPLPGRWVELPVAIRPRPQAWTPALTAARKEDGSRPAVGVWTPAQTAAFLASVRDERLYALFHLVALRGLRRGEAAGLRWADLDLEARP